MSIKQLSIIIPVYNLEKYIQYCIDSIGVVDEKKVEIILVDDGSSDHTANICDELNEGNKSIRVIHQENSGAAVSRNVGMKAANGKYLMFVDGDDFLQAGALQKILPLLSEDIDIFCFNRFTEYYSDVEIVEQRHLKAEKLLNADGNVSKNTFQLVSPLPMPWLYVIMKDYIVSHGIYMKAGLLDEDEEWTARLFAWQPRVKVIQEGYYMYRRNRMDSLTYGRTISNSLADVEIIRLLQKEIKEEPYSYVGKQILNNKCRQMVNKVLDDIPRWDKDCALKAGVAIAPYRKLLKTGIKAERIHYYCDGLFGRERTTRAIESLVDIRR